MSYVNGVDVSHWQGEIIWPILAAAGARYAFIRAGSCNMHTGICYTDYEFDRNRIQGPGLIPCGPYWFFRADHNPYKQARYFWNITKDFHFLLPMVCDVETNQKPSGKIIPRWLFSSSLAKFLVEVKRLSGKRPIIYTNQNFNSMVDDSPIWSLYDLWIASYTKAAEPQMPAFWNDYTFWQWSADRGETANTDGMKYGCPGSTAIDKNRFPGTWVEFLAYIGEIPLEPRPEPPEPIEPDPEDPDLFLPYVAKVNAPRGLFTHTEPNKLESTRAGSLAHHTEVRVIDRDGLWLLNEAKYWSHSKYLVRV